MRLNTVRDLGLYVKDCRRQLGITQTHLATSAQVSRRWLSDLEAGKQTAEVGLVFKVLHALGLGLDVTRIEYGPGDIDLTRFFAHMAGAADRRPTVADDRELVV